MKRLTGINELDLINCMYAIRYSIERLNLNNSKDSKKILLGISEKIDSCILDDIALKISNEEEFHLYLSLCFYKEELDLKGEDIGANSINETLLNMFGDIMADIIADI